MIKRLEIIVYVIYFVFFDFLCVFFVKDFYDVSKISNKSWSEDLGDVFEFIENKKDLNEIVLIIGLFYFIFDICKRLK